MNTTPSVWNSLKVVALSLLSSILFALALPPLNVPLLGFAIFVPLLIAVRNQRVLIASGLGLMTSLVCGLILAGKIESSSQYANMVAAFGGLALTTAITAGFSSYASNRMSLSMWVFFIGLVGVFSEFFVSMIFPVNSALVLYQNPFALNVASVFGVWGVTFIVWFVAASIAALILERKQAVIPAAISLILIICSLAVGFPVDNNSTKISVAAIQAPDSSNASDETGKIGNKIKIAVWPEILMGTIGDDAPKSAKKHKIYIVGSYSEVKLGKDPKNVAYLVSPDGKYSGRSEKKHLFGKENYSFHSDADVRVVNAGDIKLGMPVCFDTMYTDVTLKLARNGARIFFVPNSDPDMPNGLLCRLHVATVAFRAAETGCPIVWAEVMNLSTIYDRYGRRLIQAPLATVSSVYADVSLGRKTIYTRLGNFFPWICLAGMVVICIFARKNRLKDI